MQSRTLYLLLAFAVTMAAVTAYWDEDEDDDEMFEIEDYLEKRGKKGRGKGKGKGKGKGRGGRRRETTWEVCPDNDRCQCILSKSGNIKVRGSCQQMVPSGFGI